jgi:cellulose synthase/poly-beta-1,6-N-acetylglucosamine synthase-like glycosyltransferase
MTDLLASLSEAFNNFMILYFALLNAMYSALLYLGWRGIRDYVHRRGMLDYDTMSTSALTTAVSIVAPAYNEGPVIVDSVRALLAVRYPTFEVLVVNDGSTDDTLATLIDAFSLVPVEYVPRAGLRTQPVRQVYVSPVHDGLVVVDKAHGGKADSINAGLCYARYPLFCCVDADTMIEADALVRLVRPFQVDPTTVACGGVVRIVNGSVVRDGIVSEVRTPRNMLVNIQIVEYLRAFMTGRVGWSRLGALLIISGAFGMFRREDVIEAGGYDTATVGEDAELVVRLHRRCREQRRPYRVVFIADPVCWTQAPSSARLLARQRNRWHRGLIEALIKHSAMAFDRRYGVVGMFAMPYFVFFEALGPVVEFFGYVNFAVGLAFGWLTPALAFSFFVLSILYGLVLSFGALLIEEHAFRRYRAWRCTARLMAAAWLENFGYRQVATAMRTWAFVSLARRRRAWGDMPRAQFGAAEPAEPADELREAA